MVGVLFGRWSVVGFPFGRWSVVNFWFGRWFLWSVLVLVGGRCFNQYMVGGRWLMVGGLWSVVGGFVLRCFRNFTCR